jgi:hypothetical protein
VDGVRFITADREKDKKTKNNGVMAEGFHNNKPRDFFGVLKEIKVLYFNSDAEHQRSVVLFNCDWFRLDGLKTPLEVYDKVFRSINITNCWYKDDNFILSTQATKVFYVPDTKFGMSFKNLSIDTGLMLAKLMRIWLLILHTRRL